MRSITVTESQLAVLIQSLHRLIESHNIFFFIIIYIGITFGHKSQPFSLHCDLSAQKSHAYFSFSFTNQFPFTYLLWSGTGWDANMAIMTSRFWVHVNFANSFAKCQTSCCRESKQRERDFEPTLRFHASYNGSPQSLCCSVIHDSAFSLTCVFDIRHSFVCRKPRKYSFRGRVIMKVPDSGIILWEVNVSVSKVHFWTH